MSARTTTDLSRACDVLVIGAGAAGYCAAIAAARHGCGTVLVEKDNVLGGNSGPNVGVGITGADRYHFYAAETGIVHQIQEEAAYIDALGLRAGAYTISRRFEAVVQSALAQAGVTVLKSHYAREPVLRGRRIAAVIADDLAGFRTLRIEVGGCVIEASGDGEIGVRAGADYAMGSEARSEYGERSAPEEASPLVQGTSLVAIAYDAGRPVSFTPPPGTPPYVPRLAEGSVRNAVVHPLDSLLRAWSEGGRGPQFLYMTEYGGDKDTVRDDGQIYDALLMRLWAEWDHIKNGPYAAQASNWDLLWVSPKGGKRESRRLLGDHVLTQTDLEAGRRFADDIAYGGHNLDDHRPLPSGHTEIHGHSIPPLYGIPLRACYSRNIDNLLMAGRLISATHLAHASLRVMRTGAAVGQGVGTAAALCVRHRCTPRELARDGVDELQDELLRADASLLCRPLPPAGDLARRATVTASSQWTFNRSLEPADGLPVLHCLGALLYTWQERLDSVELYLKNCAGTAQDVKLGILRTTRTPPWRPTDHWCKLDRTRLPAAGFVRLAETASRLPAGFAGWHRLRLKQALAPKDPASDDDALLVCLEAPPAVLWCRAQETVEHAELWELVAGDDHWRPLPASPALRLHPEPPLGEAAHVTDGYGRRFSTGPLHMWVSARSAMPQHVMLSWPRPVAFSRVAIRFDNLARRMLDNPWEHGPRVLPYLVKDYALDAWRNGRWSPIVAVADNFRRFRVHEFRPLSTPRLRLRILAMHGEGERARVYEIGVFRA